MRALARLTRSTFGIAEDARDRFRDGDHLIPLDERVQADRHVRASGEAATDSQGEANLLATTDRGEADVVDLRIRAPVPAPGDRNLELPREVREVGVAVHVAIERDRDRRGIDDLASIDARQRTSGHRAGVVAARALARPADRGECIPDRGDVLDTEPVQLEVLAVGDVECPARVAVGEVRDRPAHRGCQHAVGRTEAHHEVADRLTPDSSAIALRVQAPRAKRTARSSAGMLSKPSTA